jgi:acetolactate decarboxylase
MRAAPGPFAFRFSCSSRSKKSVKTHTLFQVSSSGTPVAGVFDREVTVKAILEYGNFGLGTFARLDGEMVVLEGRAFQVLGTGRVLEASPDAGAPFAVVTRFSPHIHVNCRPVASFKDLEKCCDAYRLTGNIFYAIRLDGHFSRIGTRAVDSSSPSSCFTESTKAQSESSFTALDGTLAGLWSPGFSSAFCDRGYHFYFISKDRQRGGRLQDVAAVGLSLRIESLTDFHLAMSASEAFLQAHLSKDTASKLAYAVSPN